MGPGNMKVACSILNRNDAMKKIFILD